MHLPATLTRWIVASCGALLLLAQVLGLHYHRHIELHGGGGHGSELHFEDGGLHLDEQRPEHRHAHAGNGESAHLHVDVESEAVKPGLAKVFVDSLLLALLWRVVLALVVRGRDAPPRPRRLRILWRAGPCRLRPPAQAPPANLVSA